MIPLRSETPEHIFEFAAGNPFVNPSALHVRNNLPSKIYRYTTEAYYNASMLSGNWSLSPVRSYRDAILHGAERGDELEAERNFKEGATGRLGMALPREIHLFDPNAWVMCCTSERNDRFYRDFPGTNCCLEITDIQFFVEIAKAMRNRAVGSTLSACHYIPYDELLDYISLHFPNLRSENFNALF
jgi:hypothetical protein